MDVNELSAITANLGTIIAGIIYGIQIYGSYIATAQGTYPRAEMSSSDDLFAAYATANDFLKIYALESGTPMVYFSNLSSIARLFLNGSNLSLGVFGTLLLTASNDINIETTGISSDINLKTGSSGNVTVESWSKLFSTGAAQNLQSALNAKATAGASTGAGGNIVLNGGIPIGTQLLKAGGGSETWTGISIPAHTHTQT